MMEKKALILLVVVIVAIVVLYHRFVWSPLSRDLATTKEEYQRVSTELRKTEAVAARLEQVQHRYDVLLKRWERAKVMLPKKKEMPSLLEGITTAGMKSGVKFDLFEPQTVLSRGIYAEMPVNLGVTGSFHDVVSFLSAIGNLSRVVNVSDVQLRGSKDDKLDVDFKAITYMISGSGGGRDVE
jgi:type IV pilus assembly protein PilO